MAENRVFDHFWCFGGYFEGSKIEKIPKVFFSGIDLKLLETRLKPIISKKIGFKNFEPGTQKF